MAFCLSKNLEDLQKRLGDIVVAIRRDKSPSMRVYMKADGAMTVLTKDAMQPNWCRRWKTTPPSSMAALRQHAHGCNSVMRLTHGAETW